MQKKIAFLLFGLTTLAGCSPDYTDRDAAISIHDEIMPKMEYFVRTEMKIDTLLTQLDSLKSVQPALDTTLTRQHLLSLKNHIESSNDTMNNWMRQFEIKPPGSRQEIEAYFRDQKEQIEAVKDHYQETEEQIKRHNEILNPSL